jgi:DNA excision repair protein ERCC-2
LQRFLFDLLLFIRLTESFGEHSLFDITLLPGYGRAANRHHAALCIRNVVPAPFLKHRFAAAHSTTMFSATLSPWQYFSDMLGTPENTPWIDVQSPFKATQLQIKVVPQISTRDREESHLPIVKLMTQQFNAKPGNYLAFFSSYEYLQNVLTLLRNRSPHIVVWEQSRAMDEADKERFLAQFIHGGQGIGFAVLGGAFGEGIDLPGNRLIGAFISTLGLSQINPVNEQIKMLMQTMFGRGYDYAYLYPGLQKVVQAAGRVIRTTDDQGSIFLMDDRFEQSEVRQLLPGWWDVKIVDCI